MRSLISTIILFIILAPLVLGVSIGPSHASTVARLRIGIVEDGIYRITPADLTAVGIDPTTVDPQTFAMTSMGQSIAILVTGEADASFDTLNNDEILFFGEKFKSTETDAKDAEMEEKYTDERVYWLDIGGAPGALRLEDVDATPTGTLTPPSDFAEVLRAEEQNLWYTQHTTNVSTTDTWFWDNLKPTLSNEASIDFVHFVPYPATGKTATLWVDQIARTYDSHHTIISMNDTHPFESNWGGKGRKQISDTLSSGLVHGDNTVNVRATHDGSGTDWIYFNYWELQYRRSFRAWDGELEFEAETDGPHEYSIDGWDTTAVLIWDISDQSQIKQLLNYGISSGEVGQSLLFRANDLTAARYWLQEESTISSPASIQLYVTADLLDPSGGADVVIVASEELLPALQVLTDWHDNAGRRVVVATFQQVIDEFNEGIYHPKAIPTMLAWAHAGNWAGDPPQYLTLVGDGHWNFKGHNTAVYPNPTIHIPPYLNWVDPWQGEVPTDSAYGDLDGDRRPDIATGRISVSNLTEAALVIGKITEYDDTVRSEAWQRQALFITDDADYSGNFADKSDVILSDYLPQDMTADRIYLEETVSEVDATQAIVDGINGGALIIQYTGHGSLNWWTHEKIWTLGDIDSLVNQTQLPVVMTFNCLDGYFALPQGYGGQEGAMAEMMVRRDAGGSVAALSPSGLGETWTQHGFRQLLMDAIFKEGVQNLGDALLYAQQHFFDDNDGPNYIVDTMMLYGDPAMGLPTAESACTSLDAPDSFQVDMAQVNQDIELTWTEYNAPSQVWYSTEDPYFSPYDSGQTLISPPTAYVLHQGAASTATTNYYYQVEVHECIGYTNSERVGVFNFDLVPGS